MGLNVQALLEGARKNPGKVVVVSSENEEALEAVQMAMEDGVLKGGYLLGNKEETLKIAQKINLDLSLFEIISCESYEEAASLAVKLVSEKKGDFLLKGQVDTKVYLKAILNKEMGLVPPGNTLSHTAVMYLPSYHKLLIATDAAILIQPNVEEKAQMIQNAIEVAQKLGLQRPKVALIAAVEKINPKMQSTVDAAELVKLHKEKGYFSNAIVEGPYDVYIATSKEAAEIKKVSGEVCGDADILAFPDINAANVFYKSISRFVQDSWAAGIIAGAKVPILLPSRADDAMSKRMSIMVAAFMGQNKN